MPRVRQLGMPIKRQLAIVCLSLSCICCSPKYQNVPTKVSDAQIVGKWYMTVDSARRLKWERELSDAEAAECSLTFSPSGECQFHSFSISSDKFVVAPGHWWLDHDANSKTGRSVTNVLRVEMQLRGRQQTESLFVGRARGRLFLWGNWGNGWGDVTVIAYTQK